MLLVYQLVAMYFKLSKKLVNYCLSVLVDDLLTMDLNYIKNVFL